VRRVSEARRMRSTGKLAKELEVPQSVAHLAANPDPDPDPDPDSKPRHVSISRGVGPCSYVPRDMPLSCDPSSTSTPGKRC